MFKKLVFTVLAMVMTMGVAFAQVELNAATQVALEGIKGIGPATAKRIVEERKKAQFKDWADFEKRVSGIGDRKAAALSAGGLKINGAARPGVAPKAVKTSQAQSGAAK